MIDFEQFKTKAEVIKYLKATKDISCQTTAQAEKYLRAHLPKESYYQDKHIKELIPSSFVWKAAAGPPRYTRYLRCSKRPVLWLWGKAVLYRCSF